MDIAGVRIAGSDFAPGSSRNDRRRSVSYSRRNPSTWWMAGDQTAVTEPFTEHIAGIRHSETWLGAYGSESGRQFHYCTHLRWTDHNHQDADLKTILSIFYPPVTTSCYGRLCKCSGYLCKCYANLRKWYGVLCKHHVHLRKFYTCLRKRYSDLRKRYGRFV